MAWNEQSERRSLIPKVDESLRDSKFPVAE